MAAPLTAQRLHETIAAVCPITGISIGTIGSSASVWIDFDPAATAAQRTAAQNALAGFNWSDAAQMTWENTRKPERTDLRSDVAQVVADIDTYLGLGNPTAAQNLAQIRLLSRAMKKVLKRLVQLN